MSRVVFDAATGETTIDPDWTPPAPAPAELAAELLRWRATAHTPKLAIVRALRRLNLDGSVAPDDLGDLWPAARLALAGAAEALREDWELMSTAPRADGIIQAFAVALPWTLGVDPQDMLDRAFRAAVLIDAGAAPELIDAALAGT